MLRVAWLSGIQFTANQFTAFTPHNPFEIDSKENFGDQKSWISENDMSAFV